MRARSLRNLIILFIAAATATSSRAQDASRIYIEPTGWSIGVNLGTTDMWGDIGTKSILDHYTNSKYFDKIVGMGGMFGRYTIHPCLDARFWINFGAVYATDEWNYDKAVLASSQGDDAYQRYARGQKTISYILENAAVLEFSPFRMNPESRRAHRRGQLFVGAGLGYFHFTPTATVGSGTKYVQIYDLHIEGDGFGSGYPSAYSLWQFCVPMSIGWRWDVGQHLNLGFEFMYRKTFTDYLDGVSGKYIDPTAYAKHLSAADAATALAIEDKAWLQKLQPPNVAGNMRGNPSNNDGYSSLTFTVFYKVFKAQKEWWKLR